MEFDGNVVSVKLDPQFPDAVLPVRGSALSSGADAVAAKTVTIDPGEVEIVPTGWVLAYLDPKYEIQVRSRSGNTKKRMFVVANQPGTIDADYRGPIGVMVFNISNRFRLTIEKGDKIAQLVVCPVTRMDWRKVEVVHATDRGAGGFGSTGR